MTLKVLGQTWQHHMTSVLVSKFSFKVSSLDLSLGVAKIRQIQRKTCDCDKIKQESSSCRMKLCPNYFLLLVGVLSSQLHVSLSFNTETAFITGVPMFFVSFTMETMLGLTSGEHRDTNCGNT